MELALGIDPGLSSERLRRPSPGRGTGRPGGRAGGDTAPARGNSRTPE